MSQRAVLRGFILCILTVFVALPVTAQTNGGTITFSPNPVTLGVGDVSPLITATLEFPTGFTQGGTQTLLFNGGDGPGYGISTIPATITFTMTPGQTTATVSFRFAAAPFTYPGGYETSVSNTPNVAFGLLNYDVEPLSVVPSATSVYTGTTSEQLTATVSYGQLAPTGPQQLVFSGLPAGASTVPSPVSYTVVPQVAYAEVPFQIAVSSATAPGRYQVTVGTSPIVTGTDTFILDVLSPGALGATVGQASMSVCAGGAGVQNTLTVTPLNGYAGSPTVTFPALPSDLRITPSPITVPTLPPARTVNFEVSASALATAGQKVVNVLVSDPRGPFVTTSFVVNVGAADFTPVVSPGAISLTPSGEAALVTASLQSGDCAPPSTITVTPSGLPAGVTATPSSGVLSAPSYTPIVFVFKASPTAAGGTKVVTFTFTTPTGATKTADVTVTVVRAGRLSMTVEKAALALCPGGAAVSNSLTVSPLDGYTGTPTVTFPSLPAGLTATPATIQVPALPPARTVAFTLRAAAGMAAGSRTVTARVDDPRGMSATVTFTANVVPADFTPAATPSALTLNGGGAAGAVSASLAPGSCLPTANVTVTPSGLPAGVTVTPTSAVLAPPAFGPATFTFLASAAASPGQTTVTFTFAAAGSSPKTATVAMTVCGPPAAPVAPVIQPEGNPQGPVTATDFLALGWGAPASGFPATGYEWRINGGTPTAATGLSAVAPPRGTLDPIQLFVRAYACNPAKGPGPEAASPVYSLSPPSANFSLPPSVVAGRPVTFTDTSSPQATSWLWFPGAGLPATTSQSPTVTFPSAGPKVIVLIATNGSGTSAKSTTVNVLPASSVREATSLTTRALDREPDGRLALGEVRVETGTTLLLRRLDGDGEAVAFLRLLDGDGRVVVERRLVLAAGEEARHDLSAFATGPFRVEVVGPEGLESAVEEAVLRLGEPEPDLPVAPRSPRAAAIP